MVGQILLALALIEAKDDPGPSGGPAAQEPDGRARLIAMVSKAHAEVTRCADAREVLAALDRIGQDADVQRELIASLPWLRKAKQPTPEELALQVEKLVELCGAENAVGIRQAMDVTLKLVFATRHWAIADESAADEAFFDVPVPSLSPEALAGVQRAAAASLVIGGVFVDGNPVAAHVAEPLVRAWYEGSLTSLLAIDPLEARLQSVREELPPAMRDRIERVTYLTGTPVDETPTIIVWLIVRPDAATATRAIDLAAHRFVWNAVQQLRPGASVSVRQRLADEPGPAEGLLAS